jgi:hypothetical protein
VLGGGDGSWEVVEAWIPGFNAALHQVSK